MNFGVNAFKPEIQFHQHSEQLWSVRYSPIQLVVSKSSLKQFSIFKVIRYHNQTLIINRPTQHHCKLPLAGSSSSAARSRTMLMICFKSFTDFSSGQSSGKLFLALQVTVSKRGFLLQRPLFPVTKFLEISRLVHDMNFMWNPRKNPAISVPGTLFLIWIILGKPY